MSKNSELKKAAYEAGTELLRRQQMLLNAMMRYGFHSVQLIPYKVKSKEAMIKSRAAFKLLAESEARRLRLTGPKR
jgi:hypothetical protein